MKTRTRNISIHNNVEANASPAQDYIHQLNIQHRTHQIVYTNQEEGIINYTLLANGAEITKSLVKIEDTVVVTNSNENAVKITVEKLPEVEPLDMNDIHFYEKVEIQEQEIDISHIIKNNLKKLRLDHMNGEEKRKIKGLCMKYKYIFHCENIALSFANAVCTVVHKATVLQKKEIKSHITSMLQQEIIQLQVHGVAQFI